MSLVCTILAALIKHNLMLEYYLSESATKLSDVYNYLIVG